MALQGKWAILYYGILASITGGWLPVRAKNWKLTVFHLVFFVAFLCLPLSVFYIRVCHWSGWFTYSVIVVLAFMILKIVNSRLHRSLGTDPLPEEEGEGQEEEEEEHREGPEAEEGDKKSDVKESEDAVKDEPKEDSKTEVAAELSLNQAEESLQHHRDSATTLNSGLLSSARSAASHVMELRSNSEEPASHPHKPVVTTLTTQEDADGEREAVNKSFDSINSDSPLAGGRSGASLKPIDPEVSILALMSPVHRSSSNVNTSSAALGPAPGTAPHYSEGEDEVLDEDVNIQRSYSMPPAMFDGRAHLHTRHSEGEEEEEGEGEEGKGAATGRRESRDRERSGICIQRNQGSRRRHRQILESQSEDELTTTEGGVRGEGEGGGARVDVTGSYPRGRRNAFRGTARVTRSATCAADGSYASSAAAARRNVATSEKTDTLNYSTTAVTGSNPTFIPVLSEESSELVLEDQVQAKLSADGYYFLVGVVNRFPKGLQEAVLNDSLPPSWYVMMRERVGELKRGHLSSGEEDSSPGAIHWYEVDGEWEFYMFQPEEVALEATLDESLSGIEQLMAYSRLMAATYPSPPPHPPPRPQISTGEAEEEVEEEKKAMYRIIPFVKKTEVPLNFPRKSLEEYMDRNVTWAETIFTIVLSAMVCIIAALLLSQIQDFFHGFRVFWLCFVVATAHFSLIKSVQDDPASPTPGQNNIMALGRAIYFIVCGTLALCIHAALENIEEFPALCVYGFNTNSMAVLSFVRDGLLTFILFFPLLFLLGLMPQVDTFVIYFMEQVDMHVFGGTASTGLLCSFYAILRSVLVGVVLWALGYAAFSQLDVEGMDPLNCSDYSEGYSPNDPQGDCSFGNRIALSFFIGALYSASFLLSRSTSNHQYLWMLVCRCASKCWKMCSKPADTPPPTSDPLEDIYCKTLKRRLLSDVLIAVVMFVVVTGIFISTAFCRSTIPAYVIYSLTCVVGVFNHYLVPHLKKEMPWLCFSEPIVKAKEWEAFEVTVAPVLSPLEKVMQWLLFVEKNVLYPLTFLFAFALSAHHYKLRFGDFGAAAALTIAGMKILRTAWTDLPRQYFILIFTLFFFNFDYAHLSEGLPLDYFIIAILFIKFYDLFLKMQFIYIYIAPWQSSWSSAGHIIIQPLLIPHAPFIFLQTVISAVMNAPMNPIYASTFFMLSYARPVKYWEKDYNTKRSDSSNTRLETQLEGSLRNPNPDRLDSLFYEHLTWVLQKDLCGDLVLGRWGKVASGDFFILTSDRLNALVHIIEYGNGFVTFQLRGLEFRGTYCHQREVEAITESVADDEGCCCSEPGHLPFMLSCNKASSSRWLAWEVVSSCYTLHGYSISENQAHLVFNSFDYRKGYITYYIKCIIYRLVRWPRLKNLLENTALQEALQEQSRPTYCDTDPLFDEARDSDFSHRHRGILKERFATVFQPFLKVCVEKEGLDDLDCGEDSFLLTLSYAFTLLGRRMFYQHAQHGAGRRSGDNFMNGLYRMFLGDARPENPNDIWVFQDVDSIKDIIIPATRISLKVHQDNFSFSEEYESPVGVYEALREVDENHVVTHENDRSWRTAVVTNKPSLLALRYQRTEESYIYPYKLIRLTSKFIKFRVVKLNRECVRSLWTSQQHELIFLRNSDSERGSIQNHKPTLRNMVNSSMDLPIGYPIYVSPLQTSFVDRHQPFNDTVLSKITNPLRVLGSLKALKKLCTKCKSCAKKIRSRSGSFAVNKNDATQSGAGGGNDLVGGGGAGGVAGGGGVEGAVTQRRGSVDSLTGLDYTSKSYEDPFPQSDSDSEEQLWKPMWVTKHVVISDTAEIFDNFKMSWLKWRGEDEPLASKAMKTHWKAWRPEVGMEGEVIHEWRPFHKESVQRSHIDKVILLVKLTEDLYVLIKEQGVKEVHSAV